ncbi:uncharacterized protein [Rutidosis leptorrhynchoides]
MTRGIAKELRDKDCVAAITSVCWSKSGHHILVSSSDNSLILWNVIKGKKVFKTTLQQTPLHVQLHPTSSNSSPPSLCLVSPFSSAPLILDFNTKTTTPLPVFLPDTGAENSSYTPTAACFNKYGDLVYLGNSIGDILIIDHKNNNVCGIVPILGGSVIKNIVFSRNGRYLLTNSSDRTIRIYENLLPLKAPLKFLEANQTDYNVSDLEKLKAVGLRCLTLFREFQDSVTKVHWKVPCFSGDGDWVVAGSASKGEHKMYIWDRAGLVVKILEGPKEALVDLAWHPVRPIVVSVSLTGLVYIWTKDYTEHWSAFAPDYRELEENEEFVEQEDEFDLMAGTEKVNKSSQNEDDEVDITTVQNDSCFSDSDISEDELYFLPSDPCPDVPKSPLSEPTGLNILAMNLGSSQNEVVENSGVEDTAGTSLKRKRKPSKKLLELQALNDTQNGKQSDCIDMEIVPSIDVDEPMKGPEIVKTPIQKKLRSDVWNHFKKVTKPNGEIIAVCNHCGLTLTGYCGTTHLRSHYKRKHGEHSSMEGYVEVDPPKNMKSQSMVWIHFKTFKKPNEDIVVVCNICSANLVAGHGQCRRMKSHLKRKHAIYNDTCPDVAGSPILDGTGVHDLALNHDLNLTEAVENSGADDIAGTRLKRKRKPSKKLSELQPFDVTQNTKASDCSHMEIVPSLDGDESMKGPEIVKTPIQKPLRSDVWNHFKKVTKPNGEIFAVCNHCGLNLTGYCGTSHLRSHYKRKHGEHTSMEGYVEVDHPINGNTQPMVWVHFKKFKKPNEDLVVVCNICRANLVAGHGQSRRMRSHLQRKHAIVIVPAKSSIRKKSVSIANGGESVSGLEMVVFPTEENDSDDSMTRIEKVKPLNQLCADDSVVKLETVMSPTQEKFDESGLEKVKPPTQERLRSAVWKYFEKVKKPDNKAIAVCNFCSRSFVAGEAGTNHLRNHLLRKHAQHVELPVSSRKNKLKSVTDKAMVPSLQF